MNGRGVDAYNQTNVLTADPKRLVIMCYEGAIDYLKLAKKKGQAGEFEAKAKAVLKAQDVIDELSHSLDFEKGGQVAANLDSLYNYMTRRIIFAEANRTVEPLDEVVGLLEELKEAWVDISYGGKKGSETVAPVPHVAKRSENPIISTAYGRSARL